MRDDEASYRAMARDLYQNGRLLARKKYRLLGWAYRLFLAGMTASLIAFVVQHA
jgi:Pycsar effector protein